MVPSQKKTSHIQKHFFDNHAKKRHWSGFISESIFNAKIRKKKKRTPLTKRAGPLKMSPKQCVWCSKNSHQTGAIKLSSAEKKGGGARSIAGSSPRSFNSSSSEKRSLEKPLNSVGRQQVPSVCFREFMRFSHGGMPFLGDHLLYTTHERPQNHGGHVQI